LLRNLHHGGSAAEPNPSDFWLLISDRRRLTSSPVTHDKAQRAAAMLLVI
jgi:hypothetical protein